MSRDVGGERCDRVLRQKNVHAISDSWIELFFQRVLDEEAADVSGTTVSQTAVDW